MAGRAKTPRPPARPSNVPTNGSGTPLRRSRRLTGVSGHRFRPQEGCYWDGFHGRRGPTVLTNQGIVNLDVTVAQKDVVASGGDRHPAQHHGVVGVTAEEDDNACRVAESNGGQTLRAAGRPSHVKDQRLPHERDWVQVVTEEERDAWPPLRSPSGARRSSGGEAMARPPLGARPLRPRRRRGRQSSMRAHVCDVVALFAHRIELSRNRNERDLPSWNRETAAVKALQRARPGRSVEALRAAAECVARTLRSPGATAWERRATRRGQEHLILEGARSLRPPRG